MQNQIDYTQAASGFFEGFTDPKSAIFLMGGLIAIATAGSLVGLLSRNVVILLGIAALIIGFLFFHMYLPLPTEVQTDIYLFKSKIGL